MTSAEALRRAEIVLSNPFDGQGGREEAEAALSAIGLPDIERFARDGHDKEARRVVVALILLDLLQGRAPSLLQTRGGWSRVLASIGLESEAVAAAAKGAARCTGALRDLAGISPAIQEVRASAWRSCFGESVYEAIRMRPLIREQNVLLLGETGTGKELVAQAIAAADSEAHCQAINAAAIPRELLESELFGHVRGAFSGAQSDREGKITAANHGTLFLDEIADLPEDLQVKLLRVIEEDRLTPLGSNKEIKLDVRYLSATSQDLDALIDDKRFRRDLFERLAGAVIEIPPLRDRPEDLRPIADQLFRRHAERLGQSGGKAGAESTAHLSRLTTVQVRFTAWLERAEARERGWSGNVRELQSLIRSSVLGFSAPGTQRKSGKGKSAAASDQVPELSRFIAGEASLREVEDWYIEHVFAKTDFKQRKAAKILGMDRGTLARRLKQIDDN